MTGDESPSEDEPFLILDEAETRFDSARTGAEALRKMDEVKQMTETDRDFEIRDRSEFDEPDDE